MTQILLWVCQEPAEDGHRVYLLWPDGEQWPLATFARYEDANRLRGTLLAEVDAWGWQAADGGPLRDSQTPLAVLASFWRAMPDEQFNLLWA